MAVRGEGASSSTSSTSSQALLLRMSDWPTAGPKAQGRGWCGELQVQTSLGVLEDAAPVSYQLIGASAYR